MTKVPQSYKTYNIQENRKAETNMITHSNISPRPDWLESPGFLGENTCFQLLSTSKVNLVAKIMQRVYLCVIFHYKHEMAAKMATIFADVTGLQQRHQP